MGECTHFAIRSTIFLEKRKTIPSVVGCNQVKHLYLPCFLVLLLTFSLLGIIILCLLLLVVGGSLVISERLQAKGNTNLVRFLQADTLFVRHGEINAVGGRMQRYDSWEFYILPFTMSALGAPFLRTYRTLVYSLLAARLMLN